MKSKFNVRILCAVASIFLMISCGGGGGMGSGEVDETAFDPLPLSIMPDESMIVFDPDGGIYPVNQLMLRLIDGASRVDAEEIAQSLNATVVGYLPIIELYQLEVPASTIVELNQFIESIEQDPRVGAAFQNDYYSPQLPTDLNNLGTQNPDLIGAYEVIRIRQAWELINEYQPETRKVVVGVVDTGVLSSHPEFLDVPLDMPSNAQPGEVPDWYKECNPNSWKGYESHGTATAGVIGAGNLSAVAPLPPDSHEMNGILSGFVGSNYSLAVRNFGAYATTLGSLISLFPKGREAEWPAVVNMSFSSSKCLNENGSDENGSDSCRPCLSEKGFREQKRAYEKLFARYKNTTLFVAAAGNKEELAEYFLPAGAEAENLITVGATELNDTRAEFSNYGTKVDIAAPGVNVYAPVVSQENSGVAAYASPLNPDSPFKVCTNGYYCGTSAAASLVTGVAAMLMAIDPTPAPKLPPRMIKKVLKSSATPIDSGSKLLGCPENVGTGCRLDARMAVCALIDCNEISTPQVKIVVAASEEGLKATVIWNEQYNLTYNVFILTDPECNIHNYTLCDEGRMFPDASSGLVISGLENAQSYFIVVEAFNYYGALAVTFIPVVLEKILFVSEEDGAWDIFSIGIDGSNLLNLTETAAKDRLPAVSPSLRKIAFVSDRDGSNDIYVMNIDGSDVRRLTNEPTDDAFPVWSPDGNRIAFISERGSGGRSFDIYVMDSDGGNIVRLTDSPRNDTQPHWSPDGEHIVFVSEREGTADVFVMKADGSDQTNLTKTSAKDTIPFFSPDGSQISFVSDRDGNFDLWIMDVNGENLIKLTSDETDEVGWYSWSPDGTLIAFDSKATGIYEIYVVDMVSGNIKQLTDNPASNRFASWTWYGSKIAYLADEDGAYTLNVVDPENRGIVSLFEGASKDLYLPATSPVYGEGGGCFIATAAYGSYLDPRVPTKLKSALILLVSGLVLVKRSRRERPRMGKQVH